MKIIYQISAGGIVFKKLTTNHQSPTTMWLVGQHSQHKGWVFLKGLIGDKDSSESMEKAAVREVKEEGGIVAKIVNSKPIKTEYQYEFKDTIIKKKVYYYLMEYVSGNPKNHDWEMDKVKFINEKEVKKILTYQSEKIAFEEILKNLQSKKNGNFKK